MLKDQIQQDLKTAMVARDEVKVSTLRLLLSEFKNSEINLGQPLTETQAMQVVQKEIKKRQESVDSFKQAGRVELAEKEQAEANILSAYLPAQISDEELTSIVEGVITELGAKTMADMGRVMAEVKNKVGLSGDPSKISALVKGKLSNNG